MTRPGPKTPVLTLFTQSFGPDVWTSSRLRKTLHVHFIDSAQTSLRPPGLAYGTYVPTRGHAGLRLDRRRYS